MVNLQPGAISGGQPHILATAERKSTWFFEKNKPVFILDEPDGTTWIVKSCTDFVDKNLIYEDLKTPDTELKLPPGWSYRARVLYGTLYLDPLMHGTNYSGLAAKGQLQNMCDAIYSGTFSNKP